jgi:hypothetical protein
MRDSSNSLYFTVYYIYYYSFKIDIIIQLYKLFTVLPWINQIDFALFMYMYFFSADLIWFHTFPQHEYELFKFYEYRHCK